MDRWVFADTRAWVCSRARGATLEVAVGTALNLALYPADVTLTGVDLSEGMLALADRRRNDVGRDVTLLVGDAERLPLADASYDTVVCTFSCCAIPDHHRALAEMARVLRPGGRLVLGDHVAGTRWPVRTAQRTLEAVTARTAGEHFTRRPSLLLAGLGLEVVERERFALGVVERLVARR